MIFQGDTSTKYGLNVLKKGLGEICHICTVSLRTSLFTWAHEIHSSFQKRNKNQCYTSKSL